MSNNSIKSRENSVKTREKYDTLMVDRDRG